MNPMLSLGLLFAVWQLSAQQGQQNHQAMQLNAGIICENLSATRDFYTSVLDFGITFENDFYLLLHTPGGTSEIAFLLPNHPSQQSVFHSPYTGQGVYFTIEVDDVDALYRKVKQRGVPIAVGLREEPWGDRHFAILDPNGIAIDLVTHTPPEGPR